MSWPDDGLPRYVITSVSGYRINPKAANVTRHPDMPVCFQVLDRAYAHRLVREFSPERKVRLGLIARMQREAKDCAAALNAQEAAIEDAAA